MQPLLTLQETTCHQGGADFHLPIEINLCAKGRHVAIQLSVKQLQNHFYVIITIHFYIIKFCKCSDIFFMFSRSKILQSVDTSYSLGQRIGRYPTVHLRAVGHIIGEILSGARQF